MSKYLSFVNQPVKEIYSVSNTILRTTTTKPPLDTISQVENEINRQVEIVKDIIVNPDPIEKAMNSRRELDEKTAEALYQIQEEDKKKGLGEADAGLG